MASTLEKGGPAIEFTPKLKRFADRQRLD